MFVEDPGQTIERRMRMVWIDNIEKPTRAFRSIYFDRPYPMETGLINPGRLTAKRTERREVAPVNPIIHWAYPAMRFSFTAALGFAHKKYFKHESILTGYAAFCSDRAPLQKNWESRNLDPGFQAVPAEFVTELCADIVSSSRHFLPLVPQGEAPDRVVVDSANPDLWPFYADPELTRSLFRGEATVEVVYKDWTIKVSHTRKTYGGLCPISGDQCIIFSRRFLDVSRPAAARLKREN